MAETIGSNERHLSVGAQMPIARRRLVLFHAVTLSLVALFALGAVGGAGAGVASGAASARSEVASESQSPLAPWSGRIVAQDSLEPIAGARVQVGAEEDPVDRFTEEVVTTDATGRFTIEAPVGARLRLSAEGFLGGSVSLTPGRDGALGTLVLRRELSLAGRLLFDGAPVAGARVITPADVDFALEAPSPRTIADDQGRFRLGGLRPERVSELLVVAGGLAQRIDLGPSLYPLDARHYELGDLELAAPRRLTGDVVDQEGRALPGTAIWPQTSEGILVLVDSNGRYPQDLELPHPMAVTDEAGRFELQLPEGRYSLVAYREGWAPARRTVDVSRGGDAGTIELDPGVAVGGRIVAADGSALAGVSITLQSASSWLWWEDSPVDPPMTETDAEGCYRFGGLAAGEDLALRVAAPTGYTGAGLSQKVPDRPSPPAPESCGMLRTITLEPVGAISGVVVDATGGPVAGIDVRSRRAEDSFGGLAALPPPARTGPDGVFDMPSLRTGDYELSVFDEGYRSASVQSVHVAAGEIAEARIELTPVDETVDLDARVVDVRGAPVPEARVNADLQSGNQPGPTPSPRPGFTEADGRVVFVGAPTGVYSISATDPASRSGTGWRGPFRIGDRESRSAELRLPGPDDPTATVSGRLVDARGRGINGAVIRLTGNTVNGQEPRFRAVTLGGGDFRFDAVPPGPYLLGATRRGVPSILLRQPIEVGSAGARDLVVEVPGAGSVRGEVVGLEAATLQAVELDELRVRASRSEQLHGGAYQSIEAAGWIDIDGEFRVADLAPGRWRIEAQLRDGREAGTEVLIEEPGQQVEATLEFPSGFTLTGRVLWRGDPVESRWISLYSMEGRGSRDTTADEEGRFAVDGLQPGRYHVVVHVPELRGPFVDAVDVQADTSIELEVRGGAVSGVVLDAESGKPVSLARLRTDPLFMLPSDSHDQFHRADGNGRFRVGPLPAGRWQFGVSAPGFAGREPVIDIGNEDIGDVRIELRRSPGLRLRFQPPTEATPPILSVSWLDGGTDETYNISAFPASNDSLEFQWGSIPLGAGILTVTNSEMCLAARMRVVNDGGVVHVPLERGGRLELTVAGLDASIEATLHLSDLEGRPVISGAGTAEWPRQSTGEFRVRVLPAGTYQAEVTAEDGRTWSDRVVIAPGRSAEVTLR